VDQRQSLHLESVFQLAEKAHYLGTSLLHVGFGTVNGPDGKPFKTREGGVMKLDDLLENAIQKAYRRLPDGLVEDKQKAVNLAQQIAVAGLKFGDLSGHRTSDYVFDIDKILALEGKTGPYLQYACVRIQSLLKKVELSNGDIVVNHPLERNLLLTCVRYQDSFQASYRDLTPHIIADYAFTLARAFNSFYHECPIMHETDLVVKESRIQLCRQVLIILSRCLYLLGIQVPEEM
jgi:arginyl-tRNA synthetase